MQPFLEIDLLWHLLSRHHGCAKYYFFGKIFLISNENIFWKNNMISKYDFVEVRKYKKNIFWLRRNHKIKNKYFLSLKNRNQNFYSDLKKCKAILIYLNDLDKWAGKDNQGQSCEVVVLMVHIVLAFAPLPSIVIDGPFVKKFWFRFFKDRKHLFFIFWFRRSQKIFLFYFLISMKSENINFLFSDFCEIRKK